jgi:hypothetical protein
MNNFLVNQGLSKSSGNKNDENGKSNSALVLPTGFYPDRKQANIPQVLVIDVQPSSSNSTTTSSPCSSSRESAVIIPVDHSIERHQVPIIVADQNDHDQQDETSRNSSENLTMWNAFFVRDKGQEPVICLAR